MVSVSKSNGCERNSGDNRLLINLGDRVRGLRERRGITRKTLSSETGVSERHLANLEYGEGNVSVLVLDQVATALQCSLAELIGDFTTRSPEWLMLRTLLAGRNEATLRRIRIAIADMLSEVQQDSMSTHRIALIGLRGAGKSTLGASLADRLGRPFIELSREIENLAACSIGEIQAMYGMAAYRRYERRALEQVVSNNEEAVIAIPGGLVSEPDTFNLLLSSCSTVWLEAHPEDHMQRVIEQGDFRPMQGNREAMQDLKSILDARRALYTKASYQLDTSAQGLDQTCDRLFDIAAKIGQSETTFSPLTQTQLEEMPS